MPCENKTTNETKISQSRMLVITAQNGNLDAVKKLVENGAYIHFDNEYALRMAAGEGHTEIVCYLCDHGANLVACVGNAQIACSMDNTAAMPELLINQENSSRMSAFWHAVVNNRVDTLRFLLNRTKVRWSELDILLLEASERNFLQIVRILVEYGASVSAYENAAVVIACRNNSVELLLLLMRLGADIHTRNEMPLWEAVHGGFIEISRILLEHGADFSVKLLGEFLKEAVYENHSDIVRLFAEHGADICFDNNIYLKTAAAKGHTLTARALLNLGADIHTKNDYPLRIAACNGHTETVELLLGYGANIHVKNDSAIKLAAAKGHAEIVCILNAHGAEAHSEKNFAFRTARRHRHKKVLSMLCVYSAEKGGFYPEICDAACRGDIGEVRRLLDSEYFDRDSFREHTCGILLLIAVANRDTKILKCLINKFNSLELKMEGPINVDIHRLFLYSAYTTSDEYNELMFNYLKRNSCNNMINLRKAACYSYDDEIETFNIIFENFIQQFLLMPPFRRAGLFNECMKRALKSGKYWISDLICEPPQIFRLDMKDILGLDIKTACKDVLKYIAARGDLRIIKKLVEKGADVHDGDESPLLYAVMNMKDETIDYLMQQGASLNPTSPAVHRKSMDMLISKKNLYDGYIIQYFLKAGIDICYNDYEAIRIMLEKEGPKRDVISEYFGMWDFIKHLRAAGKDPVDILRRIEGIPEINRNTYIVIAEKTADGSDPYDVFGGGLGILGLFDWIEKYPEQMREGNASETDLFN
jgi:ankyrin repeat protein